jgi:hypothetical protein
MGLKTSDTHRNRFEGPIQQSYDAKTTTVSNFDFNLDRERSLETAKISAFNDTYFKTLLSQNEIVTIKVSLGRSLKLDRNSLINS